MSATASRIVAGGALLASVLFLPWWATAALAAAFIFAFDLYYEAVIAGFLMDSLYFAPLGRFRGAGFVATAAATALFLVALYAKGRLRYYR